MFSDMAPNYFRHVNLNLFHKLPSILAKVIGAFKIRVENVKTRSVDISYVMLIENVGFNLAGEKLASYDLKGTTNSRRKL
jgi:hypothetical protein